MSPEEKLCHRVLWLWVCRKAIEEGCRGIGCLPAWSHKSLPLGHWLQSPAEGLGVCGESVSAFWVNVKSLPLQWSMGEPEVPLKAFL